MKNFKELFEHQLKDLYSAENLLIAALPKMAENAKDSKLKNAILHHLEETKTQKTRLEEICEALGINASGETCKAMEGLIKEAKNFMAAVEDKEVKDAGLIAEAQRVEHYEISGYGTAVRYAKELGLEDIAKKLQTTLDEEYNADSTLNELAESRLNKRAMA